MLTPDKMSVAMGAVRDQILAVVMQHERESHNGAPCWGNRASAIAYLCHTLGVRGEVLDYAVSLLAEYDENCEQNDCRHGR